MKKKLFILFAFLFLSISFAQVENVPAEHPVYPFLKQMQIEGILKNYDDVVLPLSRAKVIAALKAVDNKKSALSPAEISFLNRMKEKFGLNRSEMNQPLDVFDGFPSKFWSNLSADKEKHLYHYFDDKISFYIDPLLEFKFIYSKEIKREAYLFNYGGKIHGSYNGWLGFYLQGTNGNSGGDRNVARLDKRVAQSYTFNKTRIDYFDGTRGYIRVKKGIVSLELGRERLLWGSGYINKLVLSENPQMFDFIRFGISYKSLSYKFIHGWLVQPPDVFYVDSLVGNIKDKKSKYIAISRLGYNPGNKVKLGVAQTIIYSNRPFEAAYLNPFLFWESAQRSLNDLDNSFLTFDGRYLISNGFEISASATFDDINFARLFRGEWNGSNNGLAWQTGVYLAKPVLPENLNLQIEYMQLRPYIYSHPGIGEALTYTNNGFLLGTDLQPNSTRFSIKLDYRPSGKLGMSLLYNHSLHGDNIYNQKGDLIRNVGGSIYYNYSLNDSKFAYLLDGVREVYDDVTARLNYEITYGLYLNLFYKYGRVFVNNKNTGSQYIWASLKLDFE